MHNQARISLSCLTLIEQHPIGDIRGQPKILRGRRGAKQEDDRLVSINASAHQFLSQRAGGRGRAVVVGSGVDGKGGGGVVGGGEEVLGVVEACVFAL